MDSTDLRLRPCGDSSGSSIRLAPPQRRGPRRLLRWRSRQTVGAARRVGLVDRRPWRRARTSSPEPSRPSCTPSPASEAMRAGCGGSLVVAPRSASG